jgi:hypothetical protein
VLCALLLAPPLSEMSYAVLKIDSQLDDEDIVRRLQSGGIRNIESASAQTVFLDDFGEIKQIPLNQYDDHIFSFDPRNDGYAEKLKSFFYQNEKQFIYIPLENQNVSPNKTIKMIDLLLKDFPHELECIGGAAPKELPWLLFFFALAGIVIFFKKLRPFAAIFFPMAGFIFWGSSGFMLAALLAVFFSLLINPLREICISLKTKKSIRENFSLYRYSWIAAAASFILFTSVIILTNVSILFSVILFAALFVLFVFFLKNDVIQGGIAKRRRFIPVPISGENPNILHHAISALPFTIAAVVLLFSSFFMNQSGSRFAFDQNLLVTKADFDAHIRFQQNFSFIPLGETGDNHQYRTYQLGDDGLVLDEGRPYARNQSLIDEVSFPLEDLADHIQGRTKQTMQWVSWETIIPLFCFIVLVPFSVFVNIKNRGRKKIKSMYNDKRIAA